MRGIGCLTRTRKSLILRAFDSYDATRLWWQVGAMGSTPNTFFDYVRVYAIDSKASVKVVGK